MIDLEVGTVIGRIDMSVYKNDLNGVNYAGLSALHGFWCCQPCVGMVLRSVECFVFLQEWRLLEHVFY